MTKIDRSERPAEDVGLQAHNISDGPMNGGHPITGGGNGPSDVLAREHKTNQDAINSRRIILEAGELDINDLIAGDMNSKNDIARDNATKINAITNHMRNSGASKIINNAYMDPNEASSLMEQEAYQPKSNNTGWRVAKIYRTLKNGKKIPVFMAEDSITGMRISKPFRLAAIAEKVVAVLNVTQNPNDTRIKLLEQAYEQHVKLMRSMAEAKRSKDYNKVRIVESKLQEINSRLGIA